MHFYFTKQKRRLVRTVFLDVSWGIRQRSLSDTARCSSHSKEMAGGNFKDKLPRKAFIVDHLL